MLAGVLGVKRAFAIGEARDEGAGAFLAENVTVRKTVLLEGALHHLGKAAGGFTEESVARINDFLKRILIAVLGCGRCGPYQEARKERDNLSQSQACNGAGFRKAHRHVRPSVSLAHQPEIRIGFLEDWRAEKILQHISRILADTRGSSVAC
ncbi:hypothetical protein AGR9A_Cc30014 [Agrobacterium salinitolerans str. Hayward 0363]|nr:hypothetical protein AGR9A_Cc30014 [Agrobacterium salinitolerans str. Hayward 0363]